MKKIILTSILAVAAMNINAQLIVDSLGRVGIGTDAPESKLSVGGNGYSHSVIYCKGNEQNRGIFVWNYYNTENGIYGTYSQMKNTIGNCYGTKNIVFGNEANHYPSQRVVGITGIAGRAYNTVGVFGGKISGSCVNSAGVYGSEVGSAPVFTDYPGIYAGYFRGKVRVTNGIYATLLSPAENASSSSQMETAILSDRGESVTEKLSRVQAMQFLRYDPAKETADARDNYDNADASSMSPEELDSFAKAMEDVEPERYLSAIQYGLDAGQLKTVYPELVYEDANGNVSINYVEMVPLLVQSINELSARVAELEGNSAKKAKAKAETTSIEDNVFEVDMVRMDQNKPNPFSESTVITLNIPAGTQSASILIYDMSGKQVQSLPVAERGETNITVYASTLTAGMYIYTLVVDGKVSVTRRMIVSKI